MHFFFLTVALVFWKEAEIKCLSDTKWYGAFKLTQAYAAERKLGLCVIRWSVSIYFKILDVKLKLLQGARREEQ